HGSTHTHTPLVQTVRRPSNTLVKFPRSALDRTSKRSCLVCIDTFLGDASMWLNRRATGRGSLQLHRGHPQIYEQFMANTQSYADSPGLHRSLPGGLSQWLARASAAGSGGGQSGGIQPANSEGGISHRRTSSAELSLRGAARDLDLAPELPQLYTIVGWGQKLR
ncbi:unnamed protein product, partial [Effrenium voratum]